MREATGGEDGRTADRQYGRHPGPGQRRRDETGSLEGLISTHGKTFAFAARLLPPPQRRATVTLYAFFRTLDDLVDERPEDADCAEIEAELQAWRTWLLDLHSQPAPREPLGRQLAEVRSQYRIPVDYFLAFLDGMAADLEAREIHTFAELRLYCYQVASTVGLAMTYVLGSTSAQALATAEDLGIAMQLTNILRDIGRDLAQGRLYLPEDELRRFGCSRADLQRLREQGGAPDERFRALMRFQITRAHLYYRRGMSGIWLLPAECRVAILLAGRLYRKILAVIERNGYDVLRRRAATTRREKLQEAAITLLIERLWRRGEPLEPALNWLYLHDGSEH